MQAEAVTEARLEASERGEAWKSQDVCQACRLKHNKSTRSADKKEKKLKGEQAMIQQLIDLLSEFERTGYVMSDEEVAQVNAMMAELGVKL